MIVINKIKVIQTNKHINKYGGINLSNNKTYLCKKHFEYFKTIQDDTDKIKFLQMFPNAYVESKSLKK